MSDTQSKERVAPTAPEPLSQHYAADGGLGDLAVQRKTPPSTESGTPKFPTTTIGDGQSQIAEPVPEEL